jgi:hypothetical protein
MKLVTELVRWFRPVPRGIGEEKRSPEDGLERDRRKRPPAAALCRGDRWILRYTAPSETRGSRDFEEAMSARRWKRSVGEGVNRGRARALRADVCLVETRRPCREVRRDDRTPRVGRQRST